MKWLFLSRFASICAPQMSSSTLLYSRGDVSTPAERGSSQGLCASYLIRFSCVDGWFSFMIPTISDLHLSVCVSSTSRMGAGRLCRDDGSLVMDSFCVVAKVLLGWRA